MQSDLETLIVLLVFAVVIWAEWKLIKDIRIAEPDLTDSGLRKQMESQSAGWDSLPDFFELDCTPIFI